MQEYTRHAETRDVKQEGLTARRIVGIILGVIEIILVFRLIFKLLGANQENVFIKVLYAVTHVFIVIFEGIFSKAATSGIGTAAVFEPATLIAMVVVALIAWLVLKLMTPRKDTRIEKTEYKEQGNQK
jgi:hypothetical protein